MFYRTGPYISNVVVFYQGMRRSREKRKAIVVFVVSLLTPSAKTRGVCMGREFINLSPERKKNNNAYRYT